MRSIPILAVVLVLVLAGCGTPAERTLPAPARVIDPAVRAALYDPIMIDPMLAQQANDDTLRPPPRPVSLSVPPDDVALAAMPPVPKMRLRAAPPPAGVCPLCRRFASTPTLEAVMPRNEGRCSVALDRSAIWATRLPANAPLYPNARVLAAAGADAGGCSIRAVHYATTASAEELVNFYHDRAGAADHRRERGVQMLTGGGTTLIARPRDGGGADAVLVTSR